MWWWGGVGVMPMIVQVDIHVGILACILNINNLVVSHITILSVVSQFFHGPCIILTTVTAVLSVSLDVQGRKVDHDINCP